MKRVVQWKISVLKGKQCFKIKSLDEKCDGNGVDLSQSAFYVWLCLYKEKDDYCFKCIFYTTLHIGSTSS